MAGVTCLNETHGENWSAYHGDCCDVIRQLPDNSIGFSVYSPPFGNLFVYSDSAADMGNSSTDGEFEDHYKFMVREKFRITKPGRLSAVHCSDLPLKKWKDGESGISDFSGQIVRIHQDAGFVLHSRVTIWKDPVVEMTRTKALGLQYGQLIKDSSKTRVGMPDYLLIFRKPGDNAEPIPHQMSMETANRLGRARKNAGSFEFSLPQWQEWASPVWMTVDQGNVLNGHMAKDGSDERHICPLQLDVIFRALVLWSNPGDVVLSPFMGIGSEGYQSVKQGRRFIGVELKESYFKQATRFLAEAENTKADLFSLAG